MTEVKRVLYVGREGERNEPVGRLEEHGFELREAEGTGATLEQLGWADCVVSEYDLHDGDGVDLLETVRERAPELPFLLFVEAGSEAVAAEAIDAGVTDYVPRDGGDPVAGLVDRVEQATDDGRSRDAQPRRLHEATRSLMVETEPERLAELTASAAREVIGVPEAAVYLAGDDGLGLAATAPDGTTPTADIDASVEDVYRNRTGEPDVAVRTGGSDAEGRACFPLGDHGVLVVVAPDPNGFTDDEVQLTTILAADAEAALDRAADETALRRERDDLAALFENIPDPTIQTRMEDGTPIAERVNPAFESTFGYDGDRLRGESVDEYIVPEDGETEAASYNDRVEDGEGIHREVRRRTTDGLRDFILHVVPHDVAGDETRGYAIYTDITEQKRRERELERQNSRIEALHGVAKRMKSVTDRTAIYEMVIDAAEEILEFDLSVIDEVENDILTPKAISSGVSLEDYYQETPIEQEDNLGAETARTGETRIVDDLRGSRYAPANFEYRSALSVPLGDRGMFQAVAREEAAFSAADRQLAELLAEHAVAAINRLERERELEQRAAELGRQNERLDRFASVVSHDLRNPLSVAKGRLELARATGDEDHYAAVERAHERMDELINGLLTLARQGELKSDPVPVELHSAADRAWTTVETGDLELVVDDDATVEADPERLRQLLENLFTNAAEHGDGATAVTVGALEDGFYVADDGVGILEAHREDVLEFGRSGTEDGTGFGLAIVKEVAEAHGWTVSATESETGGARFEFRDASDEPAA
ncbi:histidine kinase [Halobacteriales archaeon QS_4_69_225]|nr:MAG: histidine kinase [Halobacteriales archaeon QS_4_69_225]